MSDYFKTEIETDGITREYTLELIMYKNNDKYKVTVKNEEGKIITFHLEIDVYKWKIAQATLPNWIWDAEDELRNAIDEENDKMRE